MDWQFFGILMLSFFCFTSYSLPVSFYPIMAEKYSISSTWIGIILASFTIGGITVSFLLAKFMSLFGKKRLITISIVCLSLTMGMFACLDYIESKTLFLVISILTRTLHGVFFGIISSIAYAYVPVLYPHDMKKKIVLLEVVYGVSISFGAFVGEQLFEIDGPLIPFASFGILYLVIVYPTIRILPPDIVKMETLLDEPEKVFLPYKPLLTSYSFISTILVNYNYICFLGYLLTMLPVHLINLNEQTLNAYVFLVLSGVYSLTTILFSFVFNLQFKNSMLLGTIVLTCGSILIGPFIDFGIPVGNLYLLLGLSIFGFGAGIYFVILIPELILIATELYSGYDQELIGDMVSGLFAVSCFLGELIGPIFGGVLNDLIGFSRCTEIFVLQSIFFTLNYAVHFIRSIIQERQRNLSGAKEELQNYEDSEKNTNLYSNLNSEKEIAQ